MKNKIETTKENQPRAPQKPVRPDGDEIRVGAGTDAEDVIELILRDHGPLKELIKTLKDADLERGLKEGPLEEFVSLLIRHAKAEEQSLYVQMKEIKALRAESFEGDTEHALAEQLVHEINATPDDDEWNAKVKVLAELVEHHIQEEENVVLKEVEERMDRPTRQAVGGIYLQVRTQLELLNRPRVPSPQTYALQL